VEMGHGSSSKGSLVIDSWQLKLHLLWSICV